MREFPSPPDGVLRRRDFLRMTAAGAALTLGASSFAGRAMAACAPGGRFNLFTYGGYEGEGIPEWDALWSDQNIDLNVRALANEDILQVLRTPGGDEWDAFTVNQGDIPKFAAGEVFSPITVDEVPNLARLYNSLKENPLWANADGTFRCVPLTIGPLGIHWNADTNPKGYTSYADALNPGLRVSCFDNPLNMISTAACAVGLDPAVLTREQLQGPVRDWLLKLRPQLRVISPSLGDQLTVLINGEVDLHLVGFPWNVLEARKQGVTIGFAVPSEGSFGFVDSIGISTQSKNRCNAIAYCNAALDDVLGAKINDSLVGLGGTPEINTNLAPETRALFPDDIQTGFFDVMKWNVSHVDPDGPYAPIEMWDELWNQVKLG